MTRAAPGQGRQTLQHQARDAAASLGHELARFRARGIKRSKQPVIFKGKLIESPEPTIFEAVCIRCSSKVVIDQDAWEKDRRGFGGTATKVRCNQDRYEVRHPDCPDCVGLPCAAHADGKWRKV